eukprot:CAMPEP_0114525634 /NCGR_PEP_ID=MMETSP0109-20121206/22541_1 /TAXON_ID=29199 /ORGANISM="Chlorarachnion reptans, Strain CCCM449" /LENGTH=310 /DNA_ID=CAMNT_0001707253 /DNA_START=78 /DNA_END=1010 /DNA_ORIENTATION=-
MAKAATALKRNGFAVVERAVSPEAADELRCEIEELRDQKLMYKNATHVVSREGTKQYLEKSMIFEWDSMHPGWQASTSTIPNLNAIHKDLTLCNGISKTIEELELTSQTLKMQYNAGLGGCFPIHFDTDAGLDARAVTAILYLNKHWKPGDGGEIVLYPWPQEIVKIEPRSERMVMFSSANMPHRVMPSAVQRYCLTLWLSKARSNPDSGKETEKKAVQEVLRGGDKPSADTMLQPACRRLLSKMMLSEEWSRSIEEAHEPGVARDMALHNHFHNVNVLAKIFKKSLPALHEENYLRELRARARGHLLWF